MQNSILFATGTINQDHKTINFVSQITWHITIERGANANSIIRAISNTQTLKN